MKRLGLLAVIMMLLANFAVAADLKAPEDVDISDLTKATQKSITTGGKPGEHGMSVVWFIPPEYWEVSLAHNKDVSKAQADTMIQAMKGTCIVAVVRAQNGPGGAMSFYAEDEVRKALDVQFTNKDGKTIKGEEEKNPNATTANFLSVMRPIMQAAIGKFGQSMYFFVYKDVSPDGQRLASPSGKGKITVALNALPGQPAHEAVFELPLSPLFKARECPKCHKMDDDVHWLFCPFCGTKLPE